MDTSTTDIGALLERTRYRGAPVAWDDIVGHAPAKRELLVVAEQLRRHSVAERLGVPLTRGVLVVGPPGCGKTMLARALATAVERPVHVLPTAELDAATIRRVYEALATTPSLVVLDEADVVLRARNRPGAVADGRLAAALCAAIDDADPVRGPVTLALTAEGQYGLDRSLLRSGRLSLKLALRLPDRAERRFLLERLTAGLPVVGDLDLDTAADRSTGATGADLQAAVQAALGLGLLAGTDALEMRHLDEAILRQGHVDEETEEDDEPTLGMRARHEAGHCLMAALTWGPASVASVTLRPGATSDGSTVLAEAYTGRRTMSVARVRDELRVRLAGTVAEALLADDEDDISTGAGDDLAQATRLLHHLVGSLGQGSLVGTVHTSTLEGHEGIGSDLMRRSLYLEVMSEAETAYGEAWAVLAEHTDAIRRVADTLLATPGRTLSGETLRALLEAVLTGRTASGTAICARRLVLAPHSGMHRGPNSHASRSRRR